MAISSYYPGNIKQAYGLYGGATTPVVAAPTNLRTTATTSSTATLAWNGGTGTFTLERALVTNGVAGAFSPAYTGSDKIFQDGPLSFGATYDWRVKETVNGVASAYSPTLRLMVGTAAPALSTPANLRQSTSTSSSNTLAWDQVPNATGYELQRGGITIYTGPSRTYLDSGLPASTSYPYTVRALDSTNAYSPSPYSAAVTATTAAQAGGALTYTPQPTNYAYSATSENNTTYTRHSSFAELTVQVAANATYLDPKIFSNWQVPVSVQVRVNGVWRTPITMAANENAVKRITLSGSGSKTVMIRLSASHRDLDQGAVWCTDIQQLASDGLITVVPVTANADDRTIIVGDSISGDGTVASASNAWTMLCREQEQRDICVEQWGFRSVGRSLNTPALRQAQAERTVAYGAGATVRRNYVALGTNDYGLGTAPADMAASLGDYFDRVHTADPGMLNFMELPLYRYDAGGPALPPYRSALVDMASTRPWITLVHAEYWLLSTSYFNTDGLHPNESGHALKKQRFVGTLAGQPSNMPVATLTVSPATAAIGTPRTITVAIAPDPGVNNVEIRLSSNPQQIVTNSTVAPFSTTVNPGATTSYFGRLNDPVTGDYFYASDVTATVTPFTANLEVTPQSAVAGTSRAFRPVVTNGDPTAITRVQLWRDVVAGQSANQVGESTTAPFTIDHTPGSSGSYFLVISQYGSNAFTNAQQVTVL